MQYGGEAPAGERQSEAEPRTDAIEEPPDQGHADRVGYLEPERDVGVVSIAPVEDLLEFGREQAEDEPVDVVDRDLGEEQPADHPAKPGEDGRAHGAGVGSARVSLTEIPPSTSNVWPVT